MVGGQNSSITFSKFRQQPWFFTWKEAFFRVSAIGKIDFVQLLQELLEVGSCRVGFDGRMVGQASPAVVEGHQRVGKSVRQPQLLEQLDDEEPGLGLRPSWVQSQGEWELDQLRLSFMGRTHFLTSLEANYCKP